MPVKRSIDTTLNDSDKTVTVPNGKVWKVVNIHVNLVTTATVGNRQMEVLMADSNSDVIASARAEATQAASLTYDYDFGIGLPRDAAVKALELNTPLPEVWLLETDTIQVHDSAAVDAAADDMEVIITYEEYPVGRI